MWTCPNIPILKKFRRQAIRPIRFAKRLCMRCGRKLTPDEHTKYCWVCKAKYNEAKKKYRKTTNRAYDIARMKTERRNNPQKYRAAKRKSYEKRKLSETCLRCKLPHLEDSAYCHEHRDMVRKYARNYQANRRNNQNTTAAKQAA